MATIAATSTSTSGTSHQRRCRRGDGTGGSQPKGPADTIGSVVSELMVSLAVVVGAVLAVLLLAFSGPDKPATTRRPRRRARAAKSRFPSPRSQSAHPPARIFQEELALPARPPGWVPRARARQALAPAAALSMGKVERLDRRVRLRSSFALLFLLTVVGTMLAGAIGTALFLA